MPGINDIQDYMISHALGVGLSVLGGSGNLRGRKVRPYVKGGLVSGIPDRLGMKSQFCGAGQNFIV